MALFIAVTENEPNLSSSILVFDDPFHSQDRSRRSRTVECIHRLAATCRQCFILSHELDFANEAARMPSRKVRTFTLQPLTDHLLLEARQLPPLPAHSYRQDYGALTQFLRDPTSFSGREKDVARCIRQALEGYFHAKFPESWGGKDWIGDMIRKIRESESGDPLHQAKHLEQDLTEVNEWGKRYYHSENDGSAAGAVDPVELKSYVEQTLQIISR